VSAHSSSSSSSLRQAVATTAARTLPRREDFPADRRTWGADLVAGLTVGVVALPLALGFGIASGVGAIPGLVTAIVAGFVAAVFGGSQLQVSGPTGAMTVVLVPAVAAHGVGAVPTLAVLAGVIVVLAGWLGLGRAVTLIPWPVVEGFTFGIATIIALQQLPLLLDVPRSHAHDTLHAALRAVQAADWQAARGSLAIALLVVVTMLVCRRLHPSAPGSLIGVALATIAVVAFDVHTSTIGAIHLDSLRVGHALPSSMSQFDALLGPAVVVALLAALESLLSARVADGMGDHEPSDPDRELVGQGLANIASGMLGGLPATGAIARTAVNVRAGARTRAAAAFHAVVLLVVLLGASGLVAHIPLAALAGVLVVTATRMIDLPAAKALLRASHSDALVFSLTALVTIAFDLVRAVEVGIGVAALLALRSTARASMLLEEDLAPHRAALDDETARALLDEHIVVYRLHGSLFFAAAQRFIDELAALDQARVVVLRLGTIHVLDSTGAHALSESIHTLRHRGIDVLVCGTQQRHRRVLEAVGIPGATIAEDHLYANLDHALRDARAIAAG
jgi:SulP family sulfate permease